MTKWSLSFQEQSTTWYYSEDTTVLFPCLDENFPKAFECQKERKENVGQFCKAFRMTLTYGLFNYAKHKKPHRANCVSRRNQL